jgi:hypothetical protein
MCVLCYEFGGDQHWTDAIVSTDGGAEQALRDRHRRVRILRTILAPYGVQVAYPGSGPHLLLSNAKGASDVASSLPEVWDRADRLAGRDIDVLDKFLLDRLAPAATERGPL